LIDHYVYRHIQIFSKLKIGTQSHGYSYNMKESSTTRKVSSEEKIEAKRQVVKKHMLNSAWTLWYFLFDQEYKTRWEDCFKEVATFDSVEDFWALFSHIQKGSAIPRGCSYYLFREGIPPLLVDEQNFRGGTWTYKSDHWRRREEMDNLFLYLMLMVIGEAGGEASDEFNGVAFQKRRRFDQLVLWTRNSSEDDKIRATGEMMKDCLQLPDNQLHFHRVQDMISLIPYLTL